MILELPSGALADLIGRRKTILIANVAGFLSFALFPSATHILHFAALAFLVGLSDSFISGAEEALVYDSFKQDGKEESFADYYSKGVLVYQVGLIIAPAIGGLLYEQHFSLPFYLYALSLLLAGIVTLFYREPRIDSLKFTLQNYKKQIVNGSREAFKTLYSKYLSLFYISVGAIGWSSTLYFNEYMLIGLGFSDSVRGIISSATRLINTVLIVTILKRSKLFRDYNRVFFLFPIFMLVSYLPGAWLHGIWGIPFVQGAMIVTTARWVVLAPLTNKYFSSENRATAISLLSLLIGVGYITLTSLSAIVIPAFGIKVMFSLLGFATLVTVLPLARRLRTLTP